MYPYRVYPCVHLYGRVRWILVYAHTNATDAAALTTLLAAPLTATRRLNGSGVSTTKAPISMAGRAFASSSARISRISAAMSARSMHVSGVGVHFGAGGALEA